MKNRTNAAVATAFMKMRSVLGENQGRMKDLKHRAQQLGRQELIFDEERNLLQVYKDKLAQEINKLATFSRRMREYDWTQEQQQIQDMLLT